MKCSEITLREAITNIKDFLPIKIIFNGVVLYNDYDSDKGESDVPLNLIPDRIWQFDKYIATSINIEIVDFHHSIITIQGKYEEMEEWLWKHSRMNFVYWKSGKK